MSRLGEIALTTAAGILFSGAIIAAVGWARPTAMFPIVISAAGLGLALWAIVRDLRATPATDAERKTMSDTDRAQARGSFIWIAVFFAAVLLVGFEWGVGMAALAFYRFEARLGWTVSILSGAACGEFLYGAAYFLNVPLYAGVLQEWFL